MKKLKFAVLTLTILTALSFGNIVFAADSAKTRAGMLTITTNSEGEKVLSLDSTLLFKREFGNLSIEKVFHLKNEDIVLIRNSEGGSGTIDGYLFASQNGVTETFTPLNSNEVNPVQNGEKITVDLGVEKGLRYILTYQPGEITSIKKIKEKSKSKKQKATNDDDCNSLYNNMYVEFVKARQCDGEPQSVSGMATERKYNSLDEKKFNLTEFQNLSKTSCVKGDWIKYSEFKAKVCGG